MHVIYKCLCNYTQGTCTQLVIIDNHTSQLFTQLFKKLKLQDTIWVLVKPNIQKIACAHKHVSTIRYKYKYMQFLFYFV